MYPPRRTSFALSGALLTATVAGMHGAHASSADLAALPVGAIFIGNPLPKARPPLPYGGSGDAAPTLNASQIKTLREDFGLGTDLESLDAAQSESVDNRFGLPLTSGELKEVEFQLKVDGWGPIADRQLRGAYPTTYAGESMDHAAGGTITISFTGKPPSVTELQQYYPSGAKLRTRSVAYTEDELKSAQDRFEEFLSGDNSQKIVDGVPVEETNVNPQTSTLDVYISPTDMSSADELYRSLVTDFPMVRIVVFPASAVGTATGATYGNDPVLGGEYIQHHPIGTGACTDSFAVNVPGGGTGLLTASHCDYNHQSDHLPWYLVNSNTGVGFDVKYANANNNHPKAEVEVLGWVNAQPKVWDWWSTDEVAYVVGDWFSGVEPGFALYQSDGHEDQVFMQPDGLTQYSTSFTEVILQNGTRYYLGVNNVQTANLCAVEGSSGSPVWTRYDISPGGYEEAFAVGVTAAYMGTGSTPTSCSSDGQLTSWTVIGNDLEALNNAQLVTGMPPS